MEFKTVIADYSNEKHGADIIHLLGCYAADIMGGGGDLSPFVKGNLVRELAKIPHAFSAICYVDNEPVGLINCFEGFSTFACKPLINIHDVIVHSDYRGLGISQLLLDEVEAIAKQRGCCKMTLEVLEGNVPAQNAYLKHGFSSYELSSTMGKALFWQKSLERY